MFKEIHGHQNILGYAMETSSAYFFFGTRFLTRENLSEIFPNYKFVFLKQVHGKSVVHSEGLSQIEADAHFTSQPGLALVSQTADCVPVLLANDDTICAIHSGWKSTALNIIEASQVAFSAKPPLVAAIGPHITKKSFEIGNDVAKSLLTAASSPEGLLSPHPAPDKTYFDLTELVRRQLRSTYGHSLPIHEKIEDTQTHPLFHSFRRDKQAAGRQFSFVVLKR